LRINVSWTIVVAFLTLALNYGSRGTFGIFLKPFATEFGASRELTSLIFSINMIVYGCIAFLTGYLNDRVGSKRVLLIGSSLSAISFFIASTATSLTQVILSLGILFGVATCFLSQITALSLLIKLPSDTTSLAMGLVGGGPGIGNLLLAPSVAAILSVSGWRTAMLGMGLLFLLYLFLPIAFLRHQASEKQMFQKGLRPGSVMSFLKERNILLLFCSFLLMCIAIYGVLSQEAAYATDKGMSVTDAAWALGLVSGVGIIASPAVGWMADRTMNKKRLGASVLVTGMGGIFLIAAADTWLILALGSIIVGITYASYMPVYPSITRSLVGKTFFGRAWGFISMGGSIGAAIGTWVGGFLYDLQGDYHLLWLILAFCFLAASLTLLLVHAPITKKRDEVKI
jgi:MFS family permease